MSTSLYTLARYAFQEALIQNDGNQVEPGRIIVRTWNPSICGPFYTCRTPDFPKICGLVHLGHRFCHVRLLNTRDESESNTFLNVDDLDLAPKTEYNLLEMVAIGLGELLILPLTILGSLLSGSYDPFAVADIIIATQRGDSPDK